MSAVRSYTYLEGLTLSLKYCSRPREPCSVKDETFLEVASVIASKSLGKRGEPHHHQPLAHWQSSSCLRLVGARPLGRTARGAVFRQRRKLSWAVHRAPFEPDILREVTSKQHN